VTVRWTAGHRTGPAARSGAALLCAALLAPPLLLGGCAGATVEVPTSFPVPLVSQYPLRVGVHLSDELTSYVFEQSLEGGGDYSIDLGGAQTTMFQALFTGLFDGVEVVGDPANPSADVAGVLVPKIAEVQFSTPEQTRSDFYEVWIRYEFTLHDGDGSLLGNWPLTAYGKANRNNYGMSGASPPLTAAALAACRDAMAFFTVQFESVPTVRGWLQSLTVPAAPPLPSGDS